MHGRHHQYHDTKHLATSDPLRTPKKSPGGWSVNRSRRRVGWGKKGDQKRKKGGLFNSFWREKRPVDASKARAVKESKTWLRTC